MKPENLIDGYKLDHRRQYPEGTEYVYSNLTPRYSRIPGISNVVVFGIQYFLIEYLIKIWKNDFFNVPLSVVMDRYRKRIDSYLGPNSISLDHIEKLHKLGYLPLKIKALPEGTLVPIGVPYLTIVNTHPEFGWLTNYFETILSASIWKGSTSATIAREYYLNFLKHSEKTGSDPSFIQWQGHDFSFRGMSGLSDAMLSGAGHLLFFTGTDTIPAIDFVETFYPTNSFIGGSVPATEHSVMCMGEKDSELETFKRLITEVYPSGIVSIVSDTWDFWKVMTEYLPALKEEILARDGRVVIRPDSGNPVDIICGKNSGIKGFLNITYEEAKQLGFENIGESNAEFKGAYEILWDTFGGTVNEKGYKVLNPKVGLIYGDSITLERQKNILTRLEVKNFSASNLVLGIGSFTYQYVTRDTFGFAMKATYGVVNGKPVEIFKDPITDRGFKKSAKGLLKVYKDGNTLKLKDQCTPEEENQGLLEVVFLDGELTKLQTFEEIRERTKSSC